jgi:hypothetical protein
MKGMDPTTKEIKEFIIEENDALVRKALEEAQPWDDANKKTMVLIVETLPTNKRHLIRSCTTAKHLWNKVYYEYILASTRTHGTAEIHTRTRTSICITSTREYTNTQYSRVFTTQMSMKTCYV